MRAIAAFLLLASPVFSQLITNPPGGGGGSGTAPVTLNLSGSTGQISAGIVSAGNGDPYTISAATVVGPGSGASDTAYVWINSTGTIEVGDNTVALTCTGCTAVTGVTSAPIGSGNYQLGTFTITSGVITAFASDAAIQTGPTNLTAGTNITLVQSASGIQVSSTGIPNNNCTFSTSATSCAITGLTLTAAQYNTSLVQCYTGASTTGSTQTPVTITWAPTIATGVVTTVTASFSSAAGAGYCALNNSGISGSGGAGSGTVISFSAGNLSPLFTSSVATATTTPALTFSLSNAGAGTVFGNNSGSSGAPAYTSTPKLGVPSTTTGTIGFDNASNAFTFTIGAAAAMSASNTLVGPVSVPSNGDLLDCVTTSTTCTLTDSGLLAANVVNASSPGTGIAHFAGSTQTVTSSLIVNADITNATIGTAKLAAVQGSGDSNVLLAGTVSGSGATLCTDSNGGATTTGCSGGGGSSALSAITAATGSNTLANGNNGAQVWNWAQTSNSQTAFTFGETTAATGTSDLELVVKTIAGSTAVPLTVQNSLTGSQTLSALQITPTWNTTGVVDAALLVNVTNTASGTGSLLADLQVGGSSQWHVDKAGNETANSVTTDGGAAGTISLTANATAGTVVANSFGIMAPATIATSEYLQPPNAVPAANTIMLLGTTTSNVTPFTYVAYTLTGMGSTFSSPLSLSTNTVTCPTCVVASSPGAGIAHFAGSTQTVTSSAVSLTADVSGVLPIANGGTNASSAAAGTMPNATSTTAASWTLTPTLGVAGTSTGTLTLANGGTFGASATISGAGVTTSSTLQLPTAPIANGSLVKIALTGSTMVPLAAVAGTDYLTPTGSAASLTNLPITLTTTGTSGAATYTQSTNTLNIPQYTGGGGGNPTFDKTGTGLLNPTADATFTYPSTSTTGLELTGTAPATVAGTGTAGSSIFEIQGATGGATSGTGTTAGAGGSPALYGGNGGTSSGGTNVNGGAGGNVYLTPGTGGAGTGSGVAGKNGVVAMQNERSDQITALSAGLGVGQVIPGSGLTAGEVYYINSSGALTAAAASSSTLITNPAVCVAVSTTQCAFSGTWEVASGTPFTAGGPLYVPTSAGAPTSTAPTTGNYMQRIGIAYSSSIMVITISPDVSTVN